MEQPAAAANVPPERTAAEGDVVEINRAGAGFRRLAAQRLRRHPGAALFLDYGPMQSAAGDSLQAIADKRPVSPLSPPGSADLTAHVDFADLADVARSHGARVQGPVAQGDS